MNRREGRPEAASDEQDDVVIPPDRASGAEEETVTAAGQRAGESLDERLAEERGSRSDPQGGDGNRELLEQDEPDHQPEMVGELSPDAQSDTPAEERAVRIRSDAPGATDDADDGYVAEDGGMAP